MFQIYADIKNNFLKNKKILFLCISKWKTLLTITVMILQLFISCRVMYTDSTYRGEIFFFNLSNLRSGLLKFLEWGLS